MGAQTTTDQPRFSPRHKEVLGLLAAGVSTVSELMARLGVGRKSIEAYLSAIYVRLGIGGPGSMTKAALWARDNGYGR